MKTKMFKISEVLQWQCQKEIDPLKINELTVEANYLYPFYGQATINNGIISFLTLTPDVINNKSGKPTILIHSNNQNIVYLETPFYLKDGHGATSVLQSDKLNEKNALYIIACIKKVITKKFEYNEKATKIALKNTSIELPINDVGEIDYKYMEEFILSIENKRNHVLKDFLNKEKILNTELSDEEIMALDAFNNGTVSFKKIKAREIFVVKANPQLNKASFTFSAQGKYPYFTRTTCNNGILGYVDYLDEEHKIKGNTIAVGMLGMKFFYMRTDFYAGQFTKTIFPMMKCFDENIALYFITCFNKNSHIYSGVLVRDFEKLFYNTELDVPIKNNKIDYDFIRKFIYAQKKQAVRKLVESW